MSSGNVTAPGNGGSVREWQQRISRRSMNPTLYFSSIEIGNTAGNIEILDSYTLPTPPGGYFWKGNNQSVKVTAYGKLVNSGVVKTTEIKFGGVTFFYKTHTVYDYFKIEVEIVRSTIFTIKSYSSCIISDGVGGFVSDLQRSGFTTGATVRAGEGDTIEFWGGSAGATSDDVILELFKVEQVYGPDAY